MEDRGNKTIMCSVFFLDIVGYSKKSVSGQISLKDRFNAYLSEAIRDVPIPDRIILDTGDGAAINFLGDVEDALKAALSLRENLLNEDINAENPLLVRMGINLGPVRLVRDINGQPNIVGDGINVAQRVMGFADSGQVLVSRSYYDAVSRLSPQYANMFHYQGSRTDKHVREHEVYAIGYPGELTAKLSAAGGVKDGAFSFPSLWGRIKQPWNAAAAQLDTFVERFTLLTLVQRAIYLGVAAALLLVVGMVALSSGNKAAQQVNPLPEGGAVAMSAVPPAQETVVVEQANHSVPSASLSAASPVHKDAAKSKTSEKKAVDGRKDGGQSKSSEAKAADTKPSKGLFETAAVGPDGSVSISCKDGTQVFVDGTQKGKMTDGAGMTFSIPPGQHTLILSHTSGGIYTQKVEIESGRTVRIYKPGFCKQ